MRAPLRARSSPLTASWCRYAPRGPRPVSIAVAHEVERPRRTARGSCRGTAPRACTSAKRSSVRHSWAATSATICWAAMSSGSCGELDGVEAAGVHRGEQRGALDQLVAGQRVEAALGRAGTACGWSGRRAAGRWRCCAASRSGTPARPDRCRCRARATRWRPAPCSSPARRRRLDPVPPVLRQAAVVRGDDVVAEALAELVREAFGEAAGVDEHQRGAVLARRARRCGRATSPSAPPT